MEDCSSETEIFAVSGAGRSCLGGLPLPSACFTFDHCDRVRRGLWRPAGKSASAWRENIVKSVRNGRPVGLEGEEAPRTEPPPPAGRCELTLLGGFELRRPGGLLMSLPTRKCELLLAYLAMPAGHAHARDKLAGLFWGDRGDEQARGSLRKALSALRSALGVDALHVDRDLVALDPDAVVVDAERLARLAGNPDGVIDMDSREFRYGDFLDSKPSVGSEFTDWVSFERTRCRNHAQTVLSHAVEYLGSEGRYDEAKLLAQRLLALDPLREQSHCLLMRLHAASGELSMALAQFKSCRELLRKELGVEPATRTLRLSQEIASGDRARGSVAAVEDTPIAQPAAEVARSGGLPTERPYGLSIAVLPFVNKSGDAEQDYFAEGLSEDVITELSRQKDFLVIARQSSFQFAGDPGKATAAAGELGVRYALIGSMRRVGDRLRITAQLIDAAGDRCVWAERYDSRAKDIFDVQDKVVAQIIASIDAQVRLSERERAARKHPESLDAWELFHRGMWHFYRFTPQDAALAEDYFRKAHGLSPRFALPLAGLAYACFLKVTWHFVDDVESTLASGIAHAEAALALDDRDAFGHVVLGRLCMLAGEGARALQHLTMATEINPSFAQGFYGLAQTLYWAGRPEQALRYVDQALKLSPKDPLASMFMTLRSFCHYWLDDFEAAEESARRATALLARETWSRLGLAIALEARGKHDEARAAVAEARRIDPNLTIKSFNAIVGHTPKEIKDRVYAALRAVGLEEG
jgi:TolB-like protein